jgi:hypothetical protein
MPRLALVVLDRELAVPCNPKSAHAGLKVLSENRDFGLSSDRFQIEVDHT